MNRRRLSSVFLPSMKALPRLVFPLLALLLSFGCVVHDTRPLPAPLSDAEAIQESESWCTSHGYQCMARRVGRRGDVVEVVLDSEGHGTHGPLRLEFGSSDRRLVRVEVPTVPSPEPGPA